MIRILYKLRYEYEEIEEMSEYLLKNTKHRPTLGIICGSGLGGLADLVQDKQVIPYEKIPNFPVSTGMNDQLLCHTNNSNLLNFFIVIKSLVIAVALCSVY
jgi:hypothetical protein